MKKIETRFVTGWSEIGQWHIGPGAPNGSCPGRIERQIVSHEVYSADYFGKGEKLYVRSHCYLNAKGIPGMSVVGVSDDGCEERIAKMMERVGVSI